MAHTDISITNNKCQIFASSKVMALVRKEFRYKHPSAFFIRPHMPKGWDGHIQIVTDAGYFPTGTLPKMLALLDSNKITYEIEDNRSLIKFTGIPNKIGSDELRGYQLDVVNNIVGNNIADGSIYFPRGLVNAAPNAGKTIIMMALHLSYKKARTLILMNDGTLFKQFLKDMPKVFKPGEWGHIQGKTIVWGTITIAMAQTLTRHVSLYKKQLEALDIVLVDECDTANNKTFKNIINHTYNASIRIGLSGTLFKRNLAKDRPKNWFLWSFFGTELAIIKNKEMVEMGFSTPIVVKISKGNPYEPMSSDYDKAYKECIINNDKRNAVIIERVKFYTKRKVTPMLIVCRYHEQVELLYKKVHAAVGLKHSVGYVHGDKPDRDILIEKFREGKLDILISSLIVKRGQNMPLIRVIINAGGGDNPETPLQIMGRGSRKHESKKKVYYDDFLDLGTHFLRHSKHRFVYYKVEGFKIIKLF